MKANHINHVLTGVVCAYSNEASLEYVRESLEKSLLTQLEREESSPTPPITVLFAPDPDLDHNASQHLHDEGANLADRYGPLPYVSGLCDDVDMLCCHCLSLQFILFCDFLCIYFSFSRQYLFV